jgi:hypothetical protein
VGFDYRSDSNGNGELTGVDFLRTPGFGGFSFAIATTGAFTGSIAKQENVWSLKKEDNGVITAKFQNIELEGKLTQVNNCNSIIVSGHFARRLNHWKNNPDKVWLNLYLDGELVDTIIHEGKINDENYSAATVIGSVSNIIQLSKPILLNTAIEASPAWTAKKIDEELCSQFNSL